MTSAEVEDLKQFIDTTIEVKVEKAVATTVNAVAAASEERLSAQIRALDTRLDRLEAKMDNGFTGVGEAIDGLITHFEPHVKSVERLAHSHPKPKLLLKRP